MRFIADSMLGRLAKWLRVMGYDTAYDPDITDREIIDISIKEGRIILTRDTLLIKRKAIKDYLFIRSDDFREQVREVIEHFSLEPRRGFLTICIRCNTPLKSVEKESIREDVPPYVYRTQDRFMICPDCRRIYWAATHRDSMEDGLRNILHKDRGGRV